MSTSSSARRVKERGGGAAPAASTEKTLPSAAGKTTPVSGRSVSTGKENSRPTSRIRASTQKPSIQPIARIDKSAAAAAEDPRQRRSSSSVPRGRSSSPSEFTRNLSDLRKNPSSRVSVGPAMKRANSCNSGQKSKEKSDYERIVSKNGDDLEGKSQGSEVAKIRVVRDNDSNAKKERRSSADSVKRMDLEKKEGGFSSVPMKRSDFGNLTDTKVRSSDETKLRPSGVEFGSSLRELKACNKVSAFPREKSANKYPSKLHEKLAFLEGKVQRIASDIKRTKEMLDMNNPDASKMILSDIQEKISGIEKAMGSVVGNDGDAKMGLAKTGEIGDKADEREVTDAKSLVNGLNVNELEARFFPHHKLIRDRTLSKTAGGGLENHVTEVGESSTSLNVEKVSHSNGNAVALEILASLKEETKAGVDSSEVVEVDDVMTSVEESSSLNMLNGKASIDAFLMADENLDEFDDQEKAPVMIFEDEVEESCMYQLNDIGHKASTGGWFVSEGESVLLAHNDGSCSFYDIANSEEKAEYKPPAGVVPNIWRDCWIIRAPNADGCSGRYVVAASAGNSVDSGFCSWDFYTKEVRAFRFEDENSHSRTALAPLSNNTMHRRNSLSTFMASENRQWWYRPCGPLIVSTASCQRMVQIFDIRDGDQVMKWELQRPVAAMDYASPLQWRNRGKVVLAETDAISLWDVSSLSSQPLLSVSSSGRKVSALHVNNTDAELGGGVRQRISSSEAEGNDGVFCTADSINILDFRHPSGIGFKIPKIGMNMQSAFSRGDSIYIGCTSLRSTAKKHSSSQIQQFSLRKQRLINTYTLPESNAHDNFTALTQVWGNSNFVMGVCGLGLYVFDSLKDDGLPSISGNLGNVENTKEIIGPDDMYYPSFDYSASRVLIISRDRPALWRYLL